MPVYEFRCSTCHAVFDERRPMADADAPASCPTATSAPGGCSPCSPPPAWRPSPPAACAAHRSRAAAAAAARAAERADVTLSSWDDYPVHQAAEFIAHPATSDRNFYDRYYFNMHPSSGDWFAIFGYGQYPNLGVVDAFIDVRHGDSQHIVRASAPLVDRGDLSVGPFRIEVLEPLRRLRVVVEPTEHSVAMDVTWEGHIPAMAEPRQYMRSKGKVVFDTQRLAQTGFWSGTLSVGGVDLAVTPDHCRGTRDRSWGVRPVGEPETDGIRQGELVLGGMWNYFPMQFDDHAIMYICHERDDGERPAGAERAGLGRPRPARRGAGPVRARAPSRFRAPASSTAPWCASPRPALRSPARRSWPTSSPSAPGYGIDADWRHGMYHGPEPVTQGLVLAVDEVQGLAQYGIVDHVAEFSYDGHVGYGLLEHGFFGPYRRYGLLDGGMGAPAD